jgi:hypothetical protein
MRRRVFDTLMSTAGAVMAVLLAVAGGLLLWAHGFVDSNVHTQLAAQQIEFPAKGSPALTSDPEIATYVTPYAGQQVTDGAQAQVFADHYIAVHLREIGQGRTYSQVSAEFLQMKPTDPTYQQVAQTRQALFMGETLRGLLLNAYAFWKMGQIALYAAIAAFVGAGLLALLAALGFVHSRRVPEQAELFEGHPHRAGDRPVEVAGV